MKILPGMDIPLFFEARKRVLEILMLVLRNNPAIAISMKATDEPFRSVWLLRGVRNLITMNYITVPVRLNFGPKTST